MSSETPAQNTTTQTASTGLKVRHGVLVRTDPVLKVYIEHTLAEERSGKLPQNHLRRSNDISLNQEHIFLTNQSAQIDAEIIEEGLSHVVTEWMKANSFAQIDEDDKDRDLDRAD